MCIQSCLAIIEQIFKKSGCQRYYMKKKIFLFCTGIIFLLAFIHTLSAETTFMDELNAKELEQTKKFAVFVKRDGDTLYLKLGSGSYSTLTDMKECSGWDTCKLYRFVDYFKDVGFYIVFVGYYEGYEYLMVSDKTGENCLVHEAPEVSPDKKRFVAVSASEAHNINGVFIWRFEDDNIIPELSYEPDEYALYEFVAWKDNFTIHLAKFTRSDKSFCPASNFMRVPVSLRLDNGIWRFDELLSNVKCEQNN